MRLLKDDIISDLSRCSKWSSSKLTTGFISSMEDTKRATTVRWRVAQCKISWSSALDKVPLLMTFLHFEAHVSPKLQATFYLAEMLPKTFYLWECFWLDVFWFFSLHWTNMFKNSQKVLAKLTDLLFERFKLKLLPNFRLHWPRQIFVWKLVSCVKVSQRNTVEFDFPSESGGSQNSKNACNLYSSPYPMTSYSDSMIGFLSSINVSTVNVTYPKSILTGKAFLLGLALDSW